MTHAELLRLVVESERCVVLAGEAKPIPVALGNPVPSRASANFLFSGREV